MQPFVHAQASARKSGRDWTEDLPIHEFMDLAKNACPDLRHRLILHNSDLGPELASRAFPDRTDARDVALAHVQQDLGWLPTLNDWLDLCDPTRLPPSRRSSEEGAEIIRSAGQYFDLIDLEPVQRVWDLLNLPILLAPKHTKVAGALLMSGVGPILARAVLGKPIPVGCTGNRTMLLDFSWVAEGMIVAHTGTIHPLERVLACFDGREPRKISGDIR